LNSLKHFEFDKIVLIEYIFLVSLIAVVAYMEMFFSDPDILLAKKTVNIGYDDYFKETYLDLDENLEEPVVSKRDFLVRSILSFYAHHNHVCSKM